MYKIEEITNKILQGDSLQELKNIPYESINAVMCSPPYWALRDYQAEGIIWDGDEKCEHDFLAQERKIHSGVTHSTVQANVDKEGGFATDWSTTDYFCSKCGAWKGQLGLEPNFDLYISHLCNIFDEVKRVLRKDGTCWVNIGETYSGGGSGQKDTGKAVYDKENFRKTPTKTNLSDKSLCLIPFRFAIEMQNRGWILRNVIIWHKPNCMPSSVKDRFNVDFEYLFFFVKSKRYYFETQYETLSRSSLNDSRLDKGRIESKGKSLEKKYAANSVSINSIGRIKRAVWTITTKPFSGSHFAVYPEELCEIPIRAGCPEFVCNKCGKARERIIQSDWKEKREGTWKEAENSGKKMQRTNTHRQAMAGGLLQIKEPSTIEFKGYTDCGCDAGFSGGICLDPFFGAGTTGLVALKQNKQFIGIELNPEYIKIAQERLKPYLEQEKLI